MSVNTIVRRSQQLLGRAADRTADAVATVRSGIAAQEVARSGIRAASTRVRKHPLRSVGAATAAGVIVGVLVMLLINRRQ